MNILLEAIRELNKVNEDSLNEKNYPELSNAVESCEILYYILLNKSIKASQIDEDDIYNLKKYLNGRGEPSFKYDKLDGYVCTSRDILMHSKLNEAAWGWAVILDGDKLSNKYRIKPFNQRYPEINKVSTKNVTGTKAKRLVVRGLQIIVNEKTNSKTFYLELIGYPLIQIDKQTFNEIEKLILDINENTPTYAFEVERDRKGKEGFIEVKYRRSSPSSILKLNANNISDHALTTIFKSPELNDKEEKILFKAPDSATLDRYNDKDNNYVSTPKGIVKIKNLLTGDDLYTSGIDITGCIKGIVVPKYAKKMLETNDFNYYNIPFAYSAAANRNADLSTKNTFLSTIEENKSIAYWLSKVGDILEPDWKIVSYTSKKDSYTKNLSPDSLDKFRNDLRKDDELKNNAEQLHINVSNPLDLSLGRVVPTKQEDSFCVMYSPNSSTKEQLTRVSSRILLWGKDEKGEKYIAVQVDSNNNYELPGGGFDNKNDTPESVLERELWEELGISSLEIKDLTQVDSYWYSMKSNWVKANTYRAEDIWTGYFNYFFVGEYINIITNKVIDRSKNNKGEKTYWMPLETLLKRSHFYNRHIVSWVAQAKKISDK